MNRTAPPGSFDCDANGVPDECEVEQYDEDRAVEAGEKEKR
jgi:hypothetical protein